MITSGGPRRLSPASRAANIALRRLQHGGRPILVVGHGRSGTSWIGHVVGRASDALYYREPAGPTKRGLDRADLDIWLTYFRSDDPSAYFERWLSVAFNGLIDASMQWDRRKVIRRLRPGHRVVVKEVASTMVVDWVCARFDPTVVFVIRHPCAVALSEQARHIDGVDELARLLHNDDLVTDFLQPHLDHLHRVTTPLAALAAVWAIRNHVAIDQLTGRDHVVLRYETAASTPHATFAALYEHLGLRFDRKVEDEITRAHSEHDDDSYSITKRPELTLDRWKQVMTRDDVDSVLSAVEPFDLERRLSAHPTIEP